MRAGVWVGGKQRARRLGAVRSCGSGWSGLAAFHFVDDGFEGFGIVEGEVGEDFAVDLDACFVEEAHQFGVAEVVQTSSGVDTLNPEGAEVAFFVFAIAVCVGETFFPSVFGNGPYVTAASEVAAGKFEDFFTACARGNVVY